MCYKKPVSRLKPGMTILNCILLPSHKSPICCYFLLNRAGSIFSIAGAKMFCKKISVENGFDFLNAETGFQFLS